MEALNYAEREKQVKEFQETKAGVKGLVDAGMTKIPKIFIHPPENISIRGDEKPQMPVIDLGGFGGARRGEIVASMRSAAETWGFFQMVNHGVPTGVCPRLLEGVRRFNELRDEEKMKWYASRPSGGVNFHSNVQLNETTAPGEWRDSLSFAFGEQAEVDPQDLPPVCRSELVEYIKGVEGLKELLSEALSEALGMSSDHLKKLNCMECSFFVGHYYPACPEPHLTMGISRHSDPYILTILLQDNTGGLQVLHQDQWVDVQPLPGALIANMGDLIQILSNDRFKSVEHKVLARPVGPRISAGCFFYPSNNTNKIGPMKELLSEKNPPIYREIYHSEYVAYWKSTRPHAGSRLPHFKL